MDFYTALLVKQLIPEGIPGKDGVGIISSSMNENYELILNFSDGTSYTTPSLKGPTGTAENLGLSVVEGKLCVTYEE